MPRKRHFTSKEIAFFKSLRKGKVPFLVVGLSAASLQGVPVVTQDIDVWIKDLQDPRFKKALAEVSGFYAPPFGLNPPQVGGEGLDLIDLVTTMHGLKSFDEEYKRCHKVRLEGFVLTVLPLERIIKSKRTAGRKKDRAVLPVLNDALKTIKFGKR